MALNLLHRIVCTNNSAASYSKGDILDIYWNDSTEEIEVELNESPVTSGGIIYPYEFVKKDTQRSAYYNKTESGYGFCTGANLSTFPFKGSFPYAEKVTVFSESCASGICDINKQGAAVVTKASASDQSDGSITVLANSSNTPVKYALFDFDYNTEGQASGTFSNLPPGKFTVYAKDVVGCRVTWEVTIDYDKLGDFGVYEYWSFKNKEGDSYLVQLLKRGYSESGTERDAMASIPVIRKVNGQNKNRLDTIFSSSIEVNVITETDREYLDLFANADETEFLIKYFYTPAGGSQVLAWQGFVVTELFTEPYEHTNYVTTIQATDRLADLKNYDFTDESDNQIHGDISVLEVIRICVSKTNLELGFRAGMNLYEENHDTGDTDDPLTQTFVNSDSYYQDFEADDCLTVLSKVLTGLNCMIRSSGGFWYIIYKPEAGQTYAYREFTSTGDYSGEGSVIPLVDMKQHTQENRGTFLTGRNSLSVEPIYKNININSVRNITETLFTPFDERYVEGEGFQGWSYKLNGETGTIKSLKENLRVAIAGSRSDRREEGFRTIQIDKYYTAFYFEDNQGGGAYMTAFSTIEYKGIDEFELTIPLIMVTERYSSYPPYVRLKYYLKVGLKYLKADGTWTTSETYLESFITTYNEETQVVVRGNFDDSITEDTTQNLEIRIHNIDPVRYDYSSLDDLADRSLTGLQEGHRSVVRTQTGSGVDVNYYYELRETGESENQPSRVVSNNDAEFVWYLIESYEIPTYTGVVHARSITLFATVIFMSLPNGEPLNQLSEINYGSPANILNLNYDLYHFDVDQGINNTERLVKNYFRLSDGSPTGVWGNTILLTLSSVSGTFQVGEQITATSGGPISGEVTYVSGTDMIITLDEASATGDIEGGTSGATATVTAITFQGEQIQEVIARQIATWYNKSAYRIAAEITTDLHIYPYNCFRESTDDNRVYLPVDMSINDKDMKLSVDMIEIDSNSQTQVSAYSSGFRQNAYR